jgi:transposase
MQKLSPEEREALRAQHKQERDKRVCDRIKAVLLFDEGWDYRQISHVLLLTDEAIRKHIQDYEKSRKLKPENGGSESKLNKEQTEDLLKHLMEHTYLYTKDILSYVEAAFGIKYTVAGMHSWLKGHDFSYKKPAVVPGKANKDAQEQWIKDYEELKKNLLPNETICFCDGVHPTHNAKISYGWIKKGIRKEIPTNTGRQRLNLSGAIDIFSRRVFVREDITLNAMSTIAFLKELEAFYPEMSKIHLFCDNARYYRNKEVTAYLVNSKVQMHFLPPYSPNLNPIERLWKFTNERLLYNKYYEKFTDFKDSILGFLRGLSCPTKEIQEALKRRITDNFHAIGCNFANSSI